jgi:hypothetical protein
VAKLISIARKINLGHCSSGNCSAGNRVILPPVVNLMEEKCHLSLNMPLAYEYRKWVENRVE